MKIFRAGSQKYDIVIDAKTTIKRRAMVENSLNLSLAVPKSSPLDLKVGDYTDIGGERYIIMDEVQYSLRNGVYEYSVLMRGNLHRLEVYVMPDDGRDEWFYYGSVIDHINKVLAVLNSKEMGWSVVLPDINTLADVSTKNINYGGMSILSALHAICSTENGWGLEFDVNGKTIKFAVKIITPTTMRFEYGQGKGLYELSRGALSGDKISTRVIGYGGVTNMANGFRLSFEDINEGKNYVDNNIALYGVRETRVNFDHIYPRRNSSITCDATQVEAGKANWTVADGAMDFDLNAQIVEKPVIMFNTGHCVGVEFEIVHYDAATKVITFKEHSDDSGAEVYVLPNAVRYPRAGDSYIFVNILMPDSYVAAAQRELLAATTAEAAKLSTPQRSYTVKCDPRYFKSMNFAPAPGDGCRIIDAAHGVDYASRIVEINYPVIYPHNVDLVLSDKIPVPSSVVMAKSVNEIKTKMGILDRAQLSEAQLRRIFHPLGGSPDIDFAARKVETPEIGSANFADGPVISGFRIWQENGKSIAMVGKIKTDELIVDLLTIQKVQAIGGVLILTPAYANVVRVDNLGSAYQCWYKPDVDAQMWIVGDQALCKNCGKYYWRLVTSVSQDANENGEYSINLSTTTADGSGVPADGDEIVLLGHRGAHTERKNALVLSSGVLGYSNPLTYYTGVNSFTLDGKDQFVIGDKTKFACHEFSIISPDGTPQRVATERGVWISGRTYYYFDRVSWRGSMWLCVLDNGEVGTTVEPNIAADGVWICEVPAGNITRPVFTWSAGKPAAPVGGTAASDPDGWSFSSDPYVVLTDSSGVVLTDDSGAMLVVNVEAGCGLWCSQATFSGSASGERISAWSEPVLQSGTDGLNGKDGKGVEFVFKRQASEVAPATPAGVNVDDSVPDGWTDDQQGVTVLLPYEFSCKRVKIGGLWSAYSAPALWAKYSTDGKPGKDVDPNTVDKLDKDIIKARTEAILAFFGGVGDIDTIVKLLMGAGAPFEVKNDKVYITDAIVARLAADEAFINKLIANEAFVNNLKARSIDTRDAGNANPHARGGVVMRWRREDPDKLIEFFDGTGEFAGYIGASAGLRYDNIGRAISYSRSGLIISQSNPLPRYTVYNETGFYKNDTSTNPVKAVLAFQENRVIVPRDAKMDMPGVLCAGHVEKTDGRITGQWGCKSCQGVKHNGQTGRYKITHNIGHLNYFVTATPMSTSDWNKVHAIILEKTITYAVVGIFDSGTGNNTADFDLEFMICGKN